MRIKRVYFLAGTFSLGTIIVAGILNSCAPGPSFASISLKSKGYTVNSSMNCVEYSLGLDSRVFTYEFRNENRDKILGLVAEITPVEGSVDCSLSYSYVDVLGDRRWVTAGPDLFDRKSLVRASLGMDYFLGNADKVFKAPYTRSPRRRQINLICKYYDAYYWQNGEYSSLAGYRDFHGVVDLPPVDCWSIYELLEVYFMPEFFDFEIQDAESLVPIADAEVVVDGINPGGYLTPKQIQDEIIDSVFSRRIVKYDFFRESPKGSSEKWQLTKIENGQISVVDMAIPIWRQHYGQRLFKTDADGHLTLYVPSLPGSAKADITIRAKGYKYFSGTIPLRDSLASHYLVKLPTLGSKLRIEWSSPVRPSMKPKR